MVGRVRCRRRGRETKGRASETEKEREGGRERGRGTIGGQRRRQFVFGGC